MTERHYLPNKNRVRNLKQYQDMPDEEFDEMWQQKVMNIAPSKALEDRIQKKFDEFAKDYDIDDLKINDKETLRALIQSILTLEDYEQMIFQLRTEGLTSENINFIDKISKVMADLRGGISRFQDDLKITRKTRKSEQETSVLTYIESLKEKAREFYQAKTIYILCPKCKMLLGTVWCQYPENKNKVELFCGRHLDNGETCGERVVVYTKGMLNTKGSNDPDMLPDSLL